MSLQLLAKQMEAKGRKGDSMLVHMTPGEVAGLQKLAQSAGGSLSVNPETGLVEANFLKRMLPTLVGLGVGAATMNPFAGAAAGAAVGGYQAKRNDQDVLLGAAMGGLGGYGGASMGAGLSAAGSQAAQAGAMQTAMNTAAANPAAAANAANVANVGATAMPSGFIGAGADGIAGEQLAQQALSQQAANETLRQEAAARAINQAAEKAGTDFAAQGISDRAGQGISALMDQSSNVGREAFMSKVGGGAGLVSDIGMATAPLMAPGKKPGEAPVDDEMYSYEYNPGRTGAERSPMATTAERRYFDSSYSPLRKIKASQYGAAQGGLMSLAEGGETTTPSGTSSEGMTGASKAAFDYLMGRSETSEAEGQGVRRGSAAGGNFTFSGDDQMYIFDPVTGQFIRNPNYEDPEVKAARLAAEAAARAEAARRAQEASDRAAEEEARRRALPNITPPRQGSILATSPGGGDYPYQPGDVIPNTPDVFSTPAPAPYLVAYDLDTGARVSGPRDASVAEAYGTTVGSEQTGMLADQEAGLFAQGGLMGLAKGGMRSGGFVVPADVVSMIGEGNTDAGYKRIKSIIPGATAIKGKDGGQADTVKTSIEGKQPARVAHGEMYIPPETVKRMGGAKKLYAMMDRVRQQATGSKKQIKPVSLKRALA
jgi:hypothetical protein